MLFYRIFPAIAAGCAALMDIQRAKVDNGWLLFCVLVSLFTRIWKMDVSSLGSWICGLLVPILILGILFIFRMLGAGDIKLLSVIGSMIGPTKILNCISYSFLIGAVISAALMISSGIVCQRILYLLHYISVQNRKKRTLLQKRYAVGKLSFHSSYIFKCIALCGRCLLKKNIFAVCDLEVDYALNFMDYLNHKKNIPFEIQAFTNVESLIAYGKMNHIELLLISQKAMCRQVQELEIGKIVILSEGVHPPDLDRYPSVYKYQASSDVVREVMACYGAEKAVAPAVFPVLKKTTEIYAVYSPLGRCLKTSFALTLGQILAKERAVLYLNLEEYSGFEEMLGKGFAQNLSDLLYFVRQENGNLIYKMNSMVQTINNLDFIPPVRTPEDIRGTAWEDWEKLIQEIVLHSNYEFVILDIGGAVDGTFQVLDMCRRIYMPVLSDPVSISKIAQFENLIRIWDYPQILTRTVKVRPPFHGGNVAPENYIEGLLWSELGDYVREILRKEKE